MKTVFEHIEYVKGKPHHIRKKIAFTAAACGTALIALVWFTSSIGTGAFSIKGSSFADSVERSPSVTNGGNNGDRGLAGAASAFSDADVSAHVEIITSSSSAPVQKKVEQTTIPF